MSLTQTSSPIPPQAPQHLFVGAIDGERSCAPDSTIYDIWPKFMVMVYLEGRQRFDIDGVAFEADAGCGRAPLVLMLNVARAARLRFFNDPDGPLLRKAMVSAPGAWVERALPSLARSETATRAFLATHLARHMFPASPHLAQAAEQIISPPAMAEEARALYRQSRGLDLMWRACADLEDTKSGAAPARAASRRLGERVRHFLLDNLNGELTIERVARECGASVSCVQRRFKEHAGVTVFEFLRQARLACARETLERDGVTIAEAAYAAGYADPSSFTAAFKKAYGVPPRRRRV